VNLKLFRCGDEIVVALNAFQAKQFWERENKKTLPKLPFEIWLRGFLETRIFVEQAGTVSVREALNEGIRNKTPLPYVLCHLEDE
jgi:hypothetical protein